VLELPTRRELMELVACYIAAVAFAFGLALAFGYLGLARAAENPAKDCSQCWKVIPPDITKDNPPLAREPILFRNTNTGVEHCFFKPNGGI
jgi:hypothetical protein